MAESVYLELKGARERLCRAQTQPPLPEHRPMLQEAIDIIDRVGAFLPEWSRFDMPEGPAEPVGG